MHNRLPERKGNPYKLDQDLCKEAQSYANELARRDTGMKHSSGNYGENLAWNSAISWSDGTTTPADKPSAAMVVKAWWVWLPFPLFPIL